jgi:hypothetical protein
MDLPAADTGRYVRFTALTNWLERREPSGPCRDGSDRLVFTEFEVGTVVAVGTVNPGTPPANTVAPSITGTLDPGQHADRRTARGPARRRRIRTGGCATTSLSRGDRRTYTLQRRRWHHVEVRGDGNERCRVDGRDERATTTVTAAASPPTNSVNPSISGTLCRPAVS